MNLVAMQIKINIDAKLTIWQFDGIEHLYSIMQGQIIYCSLIFVELQPSKIYCLYGNCVHGRARFNGSDAQINLLIFVELL